MNATNELLRELIATVKAQKHAVERDSGGVPVSQRHAGTNKKSSVQLLLEQQLREHPEYQDVSVRKLAQIKINGKTYSKSSWDRAKKE